MRQLITPNPNILCRPGWCLQYVRQAFGLPARYGTATEAWEKSTSQHRDRNFPAGVWLPVWYGLDNEPAGHVVLMAPDGSCYSTSDLGSTPHHHPDLADLERYYAYYGMTLTYRGWTEDVASYPVIESGGIAAMGGTITPLSIPEGFLDMLTEEQQKDIYYILCSEEGRQIRAQQDADVLLKTTVEMLDGGRPVVAEVLAAFNKRLKAIQDSTDLLEPLDVNLRDEADKVRAKLAVIAAGTDVQALAKAIAEQLPKADAEALVDALAARLAK